MLVARSFTYSSGRQGSGKKAHDEKSPQRRRSKKDVKVRGFGWRPESFLRAQASPPPMRRHDSPPEANAIRAEHHSRPSTPVDVPKRPSSSQSSPPDRNTRPTQQHSSARHDPNAVPPSVASLLAMTQIPRRRTFQPPRPSQSLPRRMSPAELRQAWAEIDRSTPRSLSPNSYMDVLLTPPDEYDNPLDGILDDDETSFKLGRSVSDESMPSLEQDSQSFTSDLSLHTPELHSNRRSSFPRKRSHALSPPCIDSAEDHPLLPQLDLDLDSNDDRSAVKLTPPTRHSRPVSKSSISESQNPPLTTGRASRFASNLSAGISALRSAAKTLSNFAAPSIPPDDHLTRGLFESGPPYRPEPRPRPMHGTPTAQLRRYLNPQSFYLHDFHVHSAHFDHADPAHLATYRYGSQFFPFEDSVIPLQDYASIQRMRNARRNGAAEDGSSMYATEAGRAMQDSMTQHRREPRENAEFLRICVVEMQMLRAGKIKGPIGTKPGRRAFYLPPRQLLSSVIQQQSCSEEKVPSRWKGISAEDL